NPMRVTAKRGNVRPYPFQRELLIHQPVIGVEMTFGVQRRMREEAKNAEAIIHRYHDHIAAFQECGGYVECAAQDRQPAAVNPYHHGELPRRICLRGMWPVDIQEQAVLAAGSFAWRRAWLCALAPEAERVQDALPWPIGSGGQPSELAHRRSAIRHGGG